MNVVKQEKHKCDGEHGGWETPSFLERQVLEILKKCRI